MVHPSPNPALAHVPSYPTAPTGAAVHLASNESALGPSPWAIAAARDAVGARYPDADARRLRAALAIRFGVGADGVCVTCGATEAIQLLVRTFPGEVVVPEASFPLYVRSAMAAGRIVRTVARDAARRIDLDALTRAITAETALVFVASPDNPTGMSTVGLRAWLRALPRHVVPVIDEAYAEFSDGPDMRGAHPNLVVVRSFSKAYGLASLRVGFAVAAPGIIEALDRVRDPFNVSGPAEAAALAALTDTGWLDRVRRHTRRARATLAAGLKLRGYEPVASDANFVFVPGSGPLADVLAAEGVAVRRLDAWGYPGAIRITVGRDDQHRALFAAMDGAFRCAS